VGCAIAITSTVRQRPQCLAPMSALLATDETASSSHRTPRPETPGEGVLLDEAAPPAILRGPMVRNTNPPCSIFFFRRASGARLDYLSSVDLPPGTGDITSSPSSDRRARRPLVLVTPTPQESPSSPRSKRDHFANDLAHPRPNSKRRGKTEGKMTPSFLFPERRPALNDIFGNGCGDAKPRALKSRSSARSPSHRPPAKPSTAGLPVNLARPPPTRASLARVWENRPRTRRTSRRNRCLAAATSSADCGRALRCISGRRCAVPPTRDP